MPTAGEPLAAEEGLSWLPSALENATAMVPPSERHAIHKLWTQMEDAVDGKELSASQAEKAVKSAFQNLCNMYVRQAQASAHAKAAAEETRQQMLEERERFKEHGGSLKQKLEASLGVARKSSTVAEEWRTQALDLKANFAALEKRHSRLVTASSKLLHAREGSGLSPQKGGGAGGSGGGSGAAGETDDTLLVVRLSYEKDAAAAAAGEGGEEGAVEAEADWDGGELSVHGSPKRPSSGPQLPAAKPHVDRRPPDRTDRVAVCLRSGVAAAA